MSNKRRKAGKMNKRSNQMNKRSNQMNKRSRKRNLRTCKWSLKKAGTITKERYRKLLTKKKNKKKLNKNEEKDLDRALFVNYCKCTKKLKKDEKLKKGDEYPICAYSIYLNRKMKTPIGVQKKCKRYH
jgi:hypothetical protein